MFSFQFLVDTFCIKPEELKKSSGVELHAFNLSTRMAETDRLCDYLVSSRPARNIQIIESQKFKNYFQSNLKHSKIAQIFVRNEEK